jgi:uncharacterized membrane protein
MFVANHRKRRAEMSESGQQGIPAVGFLVAAFTEETAGDEALKAMQQAKKEGRFYFEDAAVIKQDAQSKVHYFETGDMSKGRGAGAGALVGGIIGILGGPVGVALGAGIGAAAGGAIASRDKGFRDESLNTIGTALKPGTSAVAMITSHEFLLAVQKQVEIEDVRATVDRLAAEIAARLAENKNVAIGLLLTAKGLAVREIAANEETTEVVGAVLTEDAIAAGALVATADGVAYQVVGATADAAVMERGVITDDGAIIEDTVALPGEAPEGLPPAGSATE